MTKYFKLVRPDYTSFHDPKFQWPIKGVVEVPGATQNGACGEGLHLAKSVDLALQYVKFPFRILKVKPLSPILGEDNTKIRVAKAESLGELPVPAWAKKVEKRIAELPEEMKAIPWFKGTNGAQASKLIRSHFKLLVPFGFKLDFEIEILTDKKEAAAARDAAWDDAWAAAWAAAGDAARDAARDAAWAAAGDAAWDAAWAAARDAAWAAAGDAAWAAARDAARDAAGDAAWAAAWDAAWAAARDAAWDAVQDRIKKPKPFKPLWAVWKLGAWPIGFVGNKFKIYVEKK
jgi:hypothetical protein